MNKIACVVSIDLNCVVLSLAVQHFLVLSQTSDNRSYNKKIGHFLRFDKSGLEYFLKCKIKNIFDTKIASKIVRTYTDSHGLKNLVQEFCNKTLDKRQGSSDWNRNINDLTDKQLEYAANDVLYLHKIKDELEKMLIREKRMDLYKRCIEFLSTRIELDQSGFKFDIFEH